MNTPSDIPFWQRPLDQLNDDEWERLCDGCGRCCLLKLEDEESGEVFYTRIACAQLDLDTCRCRAYVQRSQVEPECLTITRDNLPILDSLPTPCAYRLRSHGLPLPPWHPLISGSPQRMRDSGISACTYALPADAVSDPEEWEDHIIDMS